MGTAIPVPVLGTLIGALVGGIAGFTAGAVTEMLGDTALQDPAADFVAAQKLHHRLLQGDDAVLAVFKIFGIDEETARVKDGWKALVAKVGAKNANR